MPHADESSLSVAFNDIPDPRCSASVRYPLPAILALTMSALLAGQQSVLAIAEWGARQPTDILTRLGFVAGQTPCQSTFQRVFAKLDSDAIARVLTEHFASPSPPDGPSGISLDGKAFRGWLGYANDGCPVHLLTAVCHASGMALAHEPIEADGVSKAEAELTVAPALIDQLNWPGHVLTGDALFCQRALCQQVRAAGGDYLLLVKGNQPRLHADLMLLFDPPADSGALPLTDQPTAHTIECGHGRQQEVRHLVATTDLTDYLDWPDVAQVFRLERTWREHGVSKRQLHYGITSLETAVGTPERLLALKRGHRGIENRLHRVKDVTFGEDASLIHTGQGPFVMALLRDTAISLLYRSGIRQVAACLRRHSQHPEAALDLVLLSPPTHA